MNIEGRAIKRLLDGSEAIWAGYHDHPFVRGIADGSLAEDKFRFYMIQDYLYLIDYAKVFALGVAKAAELADMRLFASYVSQILDHEMEIHKAYMKRLGILPEEAESAEASIDNRAYTAYMLRVAYEEGPAEIAAAILSCALSYEAIAARIVAEDPAAAEHPFYGEWVSSYADPEYARANRVLAALFEKLTANAGEAQMRHLEEIFRVCSRFEAAFWDMAWEMRE